MLLTGHGWVDAPLSSSAVFLMQVARGSAASHAWASTYPDSPALPSMTAYWAFSVLLGGLLLLAATGVLALWRGRSVVSRGTPARWATRRQERRIAVPDDPARRRWRLVAGRARGSRHLLAGDDCVSAVAFGPNGSGKTTSLIVPNVLDWDGPVVLTTAKPQDLEPICRARAAHGPVWVIAPGGATGQALSGWSPLSGIVDDETADRLAEWMVESSGMTADAKARPWNAQARKYLKGLLLAATINGGGISQWVRWIHAGERARDHVEDILRGAGHESTAREYSSTWQ